MKKTPIILVLLFSAHLLLAQSYSSKSRKAIKAYEQGIQLLRQRDFDNGLMYLEEATSIDPNFIEAHLKLAQEYRMFRKNDLIIEHLGKVIELKRGEARYAQAHIDLAKMHLFLGEYEKASPLLALIKEMEGINPKHNEFAEFELKRIAFVQAERSKALKITPTAMDRSINFYQFNSNPVLTADRSTMIYSVKNGRGKYADEDIVVSELVNGKWTKPEGVSDMINSISTSEGFASISGDGKTMVFAAADRKDCMGRVDLYISYKVGELWSQPVNMGKHVNSEAWDSEPSISADGKSIYFSSDRKGGLGGRDIYKTVLENGKWGNTVNVGASVNTPKNEVTPVIHADGRTLFYASDGKLGFGGYDIFYTTWDDEKGWANGTNIGASLNSEENEGALFISSDFKKGYFEKYFKPAQNRDSYSLIYEFDVPEALVLNTPCTYAKGKVSDAVSNKPVKASVELINLVSSKTEQEVTSDSLNGKYLVVLREGQEYGVYVEAPGYLFYSANFNYTNAKNASPVALDIQLIPLTAQREMVLPNVFFPSGEYALDPKSYVELNKVVQLLKNNPGLKVEIGGHTDNVGSTAANELLSLNRAKSVKTYLLSKGVTGEQVRTKGYGASQPKYSNSTEEGKANNRRIELRVL